jgi:hypothetical protein
VVLACHPVRYAAIAARKTMRPVRVVDDYSMSWEGNSFETGIARYQVGFNNDGTKDKYYHWCNGGMLRQPVPRLYDYPKKRIQAYL